MPLKCRSKIASYRRNSKCIFSREKKVALPEFMFQSILLARLNPQEESSGIQPVVVVLQTNNLYYPDPNLERDFINSLPDKYMEPVYGSRKTTHANVEVGPGSFKEINVKLPSEHLIKQFKKLLQLKEKMENKA